MIIKFRLVYIFRTQMPYYLNTQVSRCDQKLINGRSNQSKRIKSNGHQNKTCFHIWEANAMLNKYISVFEVHTYKISSSEKSFDLKNRI